MSHRFWLPFLVLAITNSAYGQAPPLPKAESVKPILVSTGYEFAEGPAIDRDGNLYVVNYRRFGTIGKLAPDGTASILVDLRERLPADGKKLPSCNGIKIEDDGSLIAAETGTSQIIRISKDGRLVQVVVREVGGQRLDGLNDVALDPAGNIYFANPGQQNVYRINKKDGSITKLNPQPIGSNGLGVTPDGKYVITSDSSGVRMMIITMEGDKGVSQKELVSFKPAGFDKLSSGEQQKIVEQVGVPDGLVFDALGRMYVPMWTGGVVHVIEIPTGKILATYPAGGSRATNVHFHRGDLYVTVAAKEAVFKLPLAIDGWAYSKGASH